MRRFLRTWSGLLGLVLAASMLLGGTLAWKSLDQTARNDVCREEERFPVELVKRAKTPDGTATDEPVPGAVFYLFTAEGRQLGGAYTTDEWGKIALELPPGRYCFEESHPSEGFTFDEENGNQITRYPFTVVKDGPTVIVPVYNRRATGTLTVGKEVKNFDLSPLTQAQREQVFTFTVTFSDGGSYPCRIDGGEPRLVASGETIQLRHGQKAVFTGIPAGVQYTVTEGRVEGYATFASESHGNMVREGREAAFLNVWGQPEPTEPPVLVVTKVLRGEYPPEDLEKEFHFVLTVNGEETAFTLKHGESKVFEGLKFGDVYSVIETDAFPEGYTLTTDKATGTIALPRTEALFTNTRTGRPQVDIWGEKTWVVDEAHRGMIPSSIPVRLYGNGLLVEEKTVGPNGEGRWLYTFTAPRYDWEGREIVYTIEEGPVDHFAPVYDGRNIVNVYVEPVSIDPPILEKVVEGFGAPRQRFEFILQAQGNAPLPDGAAGSIKRYTLNGDGEVELGVFTFTRPGVFVYMVHETAGDEEGWSYDDAWYTVTFTVTAENGRLTAHRELTRNGERTDRLAFRNRYTTPTKPTPDDDDDDDDDDDVRHTPKPTPTAETTEPTPTAATDVTPSPTVTPKVEESIPPTPEGMPTAVPGTPPPTTPPPSVPKTGDTMELDLWLAVTVTGGVGTLVCLVYLLVWRKRRYVGKRLMKK